MRCHACNLDPCACALNPANQGCWACKSGNPDSSKHRCRNPYPRGHDIKELFIDELPVPCPRCNGSGRLPRPPEGTPPFQREFQQSFPCSNCQVCECRHSKDCHRGSLDNQWCDTGTKEDCGCAVFFTAFDRERAMKRKRALDLWRFPYIANPVLESGSNVVEIKPIPADDTIKRVIDEQEKVKMDIIKGMGIPPGYVDTTASDAVKAHEAYIEDGRARLERAFRDMFGQYVSLKPKEFEP